MLKLLKVFSHDASFPPSGPMMNPRYSEALRMLKEAHLGAVLVRNCVIALATSGVRVLPRGMMTHFLAFSPRPEMRSKRLNAW